jgi:hypothetical protein
VVSRKKSMLFSVDRAAPIRHLKLWDSGERLRGCPNLAACADVRVSSAMLRSAPTNVVELRPRSRGGERAEYVAIVHGARVPYFISYFAAVLEMK